MMKDFETNTKRIFNEDKAFLDVHVPGVRDDNRLRIYDGIMEISKAEMIDIFEPIVEQILRLIWAQINTIHKFSIKVRIFI